MSDIQNNEAIDISLLQPNTGIKFSDFDFPNFLLQALDTGGIMNPTPVQEKSFPFSLKGSDILASAQTGTGKTLAFLLPIITNMLANPKSNALILAPTRELAIQIKEAAYKLIEKGGSIKTVSLIGGESITKQFFLLKGMEEGAIKPKRPEGNFRGGRNSYGSEQRPSGGNGIHSGIIMVGTPGRIKDHIDRNNINLDKTEFLVLDETDRMLDLGFKDTIEEIFSHLPENKQTLMFSATVSSKIALLSKAYLKNPVRIDIEKKAENAPKIKQEIIKYSYSGKFSVLKKILDERPGTAIIFVKTKMGSEELASRLEAAGIEARAIHGDLKQREREFVINAFKKNKIRVMVATDVAARGLHIPHIEFVINYDLPQCKEDYIHRIGRTGRAGEEGIAIAFVNEDDRRELKVAQSYMKVDGDLDEEDADVKGFGRDYAGKKRRPGGFGGGGFGGGRSSTSAGGERFGGGSDRGFSGGNRDRGGFRKDSGFGRSGGEDSVYKPSYGGGEGGGKRRSYGSRDNRFDKR